MNLKHLGILLVATMFISTSGVLGKHIDLPVEIIIWFRAFVAMLLLFAFAKLKKVPIAIKNKKHQKPLLIAGIFMALHWVTYFYALKLSNVAIGILSLYTFPIITAVLEPILLKTKFDARYIFLGLLVLLGLYILSPTFDFENTYVKGILVGIFSAFCYASRIVIIKGIVKEYNGGVLMMYQTIIISVVLLPFLLIKDFTGFYSQLPYLLILAILTTTIGHSLMLYALRFFTATTTSLLSSLQPIFGICLAFIFLNEIPHTNTFIGGGIILSAVVIEGLKKKK